MRHRQTDGKIESLRRVPALATLPAQELKRLAALADVLEFPEGRVLVEQGRRGDEAFLVLEGEVRVVRDGVEVSRLGPGQFVGEMALLDGHPRSATVVTTTPSRMLVFSVVSFSKMENTSVELSHRVLIQLAERLHADGPPSSADGLGVQHHSSNAAGTRP